VLKASPLLATFLTSGVISRDSKARAIRAAFDGRSSELLTNLLLVLNDHDRLDLLRAIHRSYKELSDERAGKMRVTVRSAAPLAQDQVDKLRRELKETFHKEPILETAVEPDLLGGLVVQMGDWVFDGSVQTRLESIKNQILTRSSHEIQGGRDRFSIAN
jgi:F-type H+-transporting ATPase subunit delta